MGYGSYQFEHGEYLQKATVRDSPHMNFGILIFQSRIFREALFSSKKQLAPARENEMGFSR
jgi:hypothetical protein